jgi:hypothetical protein
VLNLKYKRIMGWLNVIGEILEIIGDALDDGKMNGSNR